MKVPWSTVGTIALACGSLCVTLPASPAQTTSLGNEKCIRKIARRARYKGCTSHHKTLNSDEKDWLRAGDLKTELLARD